MIPELTDTEYEMLKAAIRKEGRIMVPVLITSDGEVIDGKGRVRAAEELELIDYPREVVHGLDAEARRLQRLSLNCVRRHLSTEQKREIVRSTLRSSPALSNNYLGELTGVDGKTVATVREELESTSSIPKLTDLRGKDGKTRPRYATARKASEQREAADASHKVGETALPKLPTARGTMVGDQEQGECKPSSGQKSTKAATRITAFLPADDDDDEPEPDLGTLGTFEIGPSGVVATAQASAFQSVSAVDRKRKLIVCRNWDGKSIDAHSRGILVLVFPELQEGCQP